MKNQYVTSYEAFAAEYLDVARGGTGGTTPASTSAFVINHETYRMFAGKHRERIRDNTLFADGKLKVVKPGKVRNTANPLKAMVTEKTLKEQIERWYRSTSGLARAGRPSSSTTEIVHFRSSEMRLSGWCNADRRATLDPGIIESTARFHQAQPAPNLNAACRKVQS